MYDYEKEHISILQAYGSECTVLLKKNGDFPLSEPGILALYGNGARLTIKGGTGSGDVNSRFYVTAEQGLEDAGFTITSKSWLSSYDTIRKKAKQQFIADIKAQAKRENKMAFMVGLGMVMPEPTYRIPLDAAGDTAIYVLSRNSGEGNDRKPEAGDIKLTETEIRDILECKHRYKRFLLALNVGGVVDLTPVAEVENILILSQLGVVTGTVLADIVLGKSVPSGKLATTWSAWEDYSTIGDFGGKDETRYQEGIYVGYRYFDSVGKQAMFPFGYGLGYTEFSLGQAVVTVEGTKVMVGLPVTNTGKFLGKEVIQIYVSVPWGKLDQPYQSLAAFAKTRYLAPGETETVSLCFGMEGLASYDTVTAAYILEAGNYIVHVGNSSQNTRPCAVVTLGDTVLVRQVTNVGGIPDFIDWKPAAPIAADMPKLPVLEMDCHAFGSLSWAEPYKASEKALKKAASLTDEDLIHLCIGAFQEQEEDVTTVIGNSSFSVAGAGGESYGNVDGVPPLVVADGPAGLRLIQHYVRDEDGVHPVGNTMPAGYEDYMDDTSLLMMELHPEEPKGKILDQYCTAIPIGTALAQSWNLDLCRVCGELVGREMELFGVNLWLAPAFNIHRTPLCGRNFEYYSEDPLVSGLVGAAVTQGVQSHPGRGTTIKHFCCNNQELNRYTSNSQVSERALREIYLRGFQICISESQPVALMTSYNLLNGIHTSERSDLLKTVLRKEWGYKGLVMTDWVIGSTDNTDKYRLTLSAPALSAGDNLFMPGSVGDYKMALDALQGKETGFRLTRAEAEYCAAHLIDLAWQLKG